MNIVRIYRDDIDFSLEDVVVNANNYVDTIKVDFLADLVSIFNNCIISGKFSENKFTVKQIEIEDFIVKGNKDFLDNSTLQKFGVTKSYVVTGDKDTVNDVINFYNIIEKDGINNNKFVFDYSHETNLQEVINKRSNKVDINNDKKVSTKTEKKDDHFKFIILILVAAVVLTIMSIMIGMKILGI